MVWRTGPRIGVALYVSDIRGSPHPSNVEECLGGQSPHNSSRTGVICIWNRGLIVFLAYYISGARFRFAFARSPFKIAFGQMVSLSKPSEACENQCGFKHLVAVKELK